MARPTPTLCLFEDRDEHLAALQLAVLSIVRHAPTNRVVVSFPDLPRSARTWFEGLPGCTVRTDERFSGRGWDVKPELLLRRIDEGIDDVVWWDSDVLAVRPVSTMVARDPHVLLALEDTWWSEAPGTDVRTTAWQLPVGRPLPTGFNSGVLRVTTAHRPLLEAWRDLLDAPSYRAAQALPGTKRPLHLLGDQEVLSALLGSEQFEDVPVELVPRGTGVAQCWGPAGFTVRERFRAQRRGGPTLVHAIVTKPWREVVDGRFPGASLPLSGRTARAVYVGLHAELSPYTVAARSLRDGLPGRRPWLYARSRLGRLLEKLPGDPMITAELPLAAVDTVARRVRRRLVPLRRPCHVSTSSAPEAIS